MKNPPKKTLRVKADTLCSQLARSIKVCEAKGQDGIKCKGDLQWCHLETRAIISLRYDRRNWTTWCSAHHWFYDLHPIAKSEWVKRNKGLKIYDFLKRYKNPSGIITKQWYLDKIEELKWYL